MSDIRYTNEFCIVRENDSNQIVIGELLSGRVETLQKIDKIVPDENSLIITGLSTEETDTILNNLAKESGTVEIIWIESEKRTYSSDEAVKTLVERGITIITVE